jgi:hypothetical protein
LIVILWAASLNSRQQDLIQGTPHALLSIVDHLGNRPNLHQQNHLAAETMIAAEEVQKNVSALDIAESV